MPESLTVETTLGRVTGLRQAGVTQFLGLSYGEAPTGALRFAAPRPRRPYAGVLEAFEYGAAAPQRRSLPEPLARMIGTTSRISEDCLNLNVWTKDCGGRRPVLVFIHGGGFILGSGAQYPGDDLCRRGDVVVVTFNYRLGLLGFNAFGEFFPGDDRFVANAGLLDQVMALEWIRDNIAAFGGDPDQVTIAGESAGAVSVAFHMIHRPSWPLFHGAILQSGGLNLFYPRDEALRVAGDLLDEMQARHDPELLFQLDARLFGRAMRALATRHVGILSRPFLDGRMIADLPLCDLYRQAKPVPLIVGTNRDEFSFFTELPMFPVHSDIDSLIGVIAPQAGADRMTAVRSLYEDTREGRVALGTDIMFRMPAIHFADVHATRAPTFFYRLDWEAKGFLAKLGATHSVDLPLLFEDFLKPFRAVYLGLLPDYQRYALSGRMRSHWLAFVRDRQPGPNWPRYEPALRQTLVFAARDEVMLDPERPRREAFDGLDSFTV